MDDFKAFHKILHINKMYMSITQKIHGCFSSDTWITMADGTRRYIADIVNSPDDVYVMGYEDGNLKPVKVLRKFNNGITEDWIKVRITNNGGLRFKEPRNMETTPNHLFYVKNKGYIPAAQLQAGDKLLYIRPQIDLTFLQKQILTGKMLGDGSLAKNSITFGHKISHEEYLKYTIDCLGFIAGNKQTNQTSGYGTTMCRARTKSLECIERNFSNWIKDNKTHIPYDLNLTPISMAFWYMDDGSLSHTDLQEDRLMIATNAFDHDDLSIIRRELQKFDINLQIQDSAGLRIRLNMEDADKFFTLIAPYIPPVMQYKLPERYRGLFNFKIPTQEVQYKKPLLEQEVISVGKKQLRKSDKNRYDLETETHNYFADGVLVHNSNAQIFIEKFNGDDQIFQIKAGSRTRWLTPDDDNYGFCKWVRANHEELIDKLGEGRHYGEWAGPGINTGEGLSEKNFIIFNYRRFQDKELPQNVLRVPVLYTGRISLEKINEVMAELKETGSRLVPGYMKPEGIVVEFDGTFYKNVFDDEEVQWNRKEKTIHDRVDMPDISYLLQPLRLEKLLSRDESYTRNYPESLKIICSEYFKDLEAENQFNATDADDLKMQRKALGREIFYFVKSFINKE